MDNRKEQYQAEHDGQDVGCASHPPGIKWSLLLPKYLRLEEVEDHGVSGCVILHLGLGESLMSVFSVFLYKTCNKAHLLEFTCNILLILKKNDYFV